MARPDLGEDEQEAIRDVLASGRLALGARTAAFEAAMAERVGARHAVAVSSGTAALHLAAIGAGLARGELMVTSPYSFIASANVALYVGATPLFVDIDPASLQIDTERVAGAVADLAGDVGSRRRWLPRRGVVADARPAALLVPHVFGQAAAPRALAEIAAAGSLALIEDACEALGAEVEDVPVGRRPPTLPAGSAHAATFGFYPNKQMTTGEGGMLVTDDDDHAALYRSLRNQGRDDDDGTLRHTRLGYNYRLDELSAALGEVQLRRLDELLARRERVAERYGRRLQRIDGVEPLPRAATTSRMSWFVYVVRLDPAVDRDGVRRELARSGIPSRPYFTPIHLQPVYRRRFGYREGDFPAAEAAGRSTLALPFFGQMSAEAQETVCAELARAVERCAI